MSSSTPSLPLHQAIARNESEQCLRLIEQGVDLEAIDEHGRTALRLASQQDAVEMRPVIRALILLGANLDAVDHMGYSARQACLNKVIAPEALSKWPAFFSGVLADRQAIELNQAAPAAASNKRRTTL